MQNFSTGDYNTTLLCSTRPCIGRLRTSRFLYALLVLFMCLLLTSAGSLSAQDLTVTSTVDRNRIALNETVTLTVSVASQEMNLNIQPEIPAIDGLTRTTGSQTSTNISIVNGKITSSRTYTYTLVPNKTGQHTIPPVVIRYKGREYAARPIQIEVTDAASPPAATPQPQPQTPAPQQQDLRQQIFLRAIPEKRNGYVNEGITITYKLYTQLEVTQYGIAQLPSHTGFWVEEYDMPAQPSITTEVVNGIGYQVATLRKIEVFPVRPGALTIDPLVINTDVRLRNQRNPRDIFDRFFDDSFFFGKVVRQRISSGSVKLNIQALPSAGKPAYFSKLVGDFQFKASIDKAGLSTDEAVTLTLQYTGTGNIRLLEAPVISASGDFEQYDPKINEIVHTNRGKISGTKTFEYVLIPRFAGEQRIEPITFTYFNPQQKTYRTQQSPAFTIQVRQGKQLAGSIPANLSREEVRLIGEDLRFIKMASPHWLIASHPFFYQLWFVVLLMIPAAAAGSSVLLRRHRDRLATDTGYARNRRANQAANKRLKDAAHLMKSNDAEAFYGSVSKALRGYVADKFNLSEAGLMSDEFTALFRDRDVNPETVSQLKSILDQCDFSRFTPAQQAEMDMPNVYTQAKQLIITLEKSLNQ